MKRKHKDKVSDLVNIHEIQGRDGNWNYDPYNTGLFNGLEMALSIMQEREPIFKELKPIIDCSFIDYNSPRGK